MTLNALGLPYEQKDQSLKYQQPSFLMGFLISYNLELRLEPSNAALDPTPQDRSIPEINLNRRTRA